MPRPDQIQFLIYPPSKELIEEWRAESRMCGTSLNNYLIEMVEKIRHQDSSNQRPNLSKELSDLKEENAKLRNELRIKELILQKYESELYKSATRCFQILICKDKGIMMKSLQLPLDVEEQWVSERFILS